MPQDSSAKPLMSEAAFYQRSKSPKYIGIAQGENRINLLNTDLGSGEEEKGWEILCKYVIAVISPWPGEESHTPVDTHLIID